MRLVLSHAYDKAHHAFYKLYESRTNALSGTSANRQRWDQWAREEMLEHCNPQCLAVYLCNTGRADSTLDNAPISDEHFTAAIDHVKQMLDGSLKTWIKAGEL